MHSDHLKYLRFASRSVLEKSVNSLLGIIEGISIDGEINRRESGFLDLWLREHEELRHFHPYNELVPLLERALRDDVLDLEERQDIQWLCERLRSTSFFDRTTADLQRLHAILGGIVADGRVSELELTGLGSWLANHEHLKTCWPYDEVDSLILGIMRDKRIDDEEQVILRGFFSEFTAILDDRTITSPIIETAGVIQGLCAVCPQIEFAGAVFSFTGASARYTREQLVDTVRSLGGEFSAGVTKATRYLIIGAEGNPCWTYACYGRKVEKAVELRKSGSRLLIVHEHDFHDAVADLR